MIVLVSGATSTMRRHPDVGVLVVPGAKNAPEVIQGRVWAMDNGAFSGLDVLSFLRMLDRYGAYRDYARPSAYQRPRFVTAPDVVGDATATMRLFREWEPKIHSWGWPIAFVGQDGLQLNSVPWDLIESVFLGGSTAFKLGRGARDLAAYGKAHGKWVHMGRVNSLKRLRYAMRIGCDSVDGTSFSRWSNVYIPKIAQMIHGFEGGPLFEDAGVRAI